MNLNKKETLAQVFSNEFCKIFKSIFLYTRFLYENLFLPDPQFLEHLAEIFFTFFLTFIFLFFFQFGLQLTIEVVFEYIC